MDMQTHVALGLHCTDTTTCVHASEPREEREHRREAAWQVALRAGIPSYDSALIGIYGEPDFTER